MDKERYKQISTLTVGIKSLIAILFSYCENNMDTNKEISNLYELSKILNEATDRLYSLL